MMRVNKSEHETDEPSQDAPENIYLDAFGENRPDDDDKPAHADAHLAENASPAVLGKALSLEPDEQDDIETIDTSFVREVKSDDSAWSLPTCITALALCSDWLLTSFAIPIFPSLGASATVTGMLFGVKSLVQLVSAPFVSKLSTGSVPLLSLLLSGLVIDLVTSSCFAFTNDIAAWFILRGAQGVASSNITAGAFGELSAYYRGRDAELGQAMGIAITGLLMGVTFGPIIAGLLYAMSPQAPFAFIISIIFATLFLTVVYRKRKGHDTLGDAKEEGSWIVLFKDRSVAGPLAVVYWSNFAVAFLEASIGVYGLSEWGFKSDAIGKFWCFNAIPGIIGSLLASRIGNVCGRWRLMLGCCLIMGVSLLIGPKSIKPVSAVSLVGFGATLGISAGTAPAVLATVSGNHGGTSAVFSMQNFAEQLAFLLGPVIGNAVYDWLGFWVACAMFAMPLCALRLIYSTGDVP